MLRSSKKNSRNGDDNGRITGKKVAAILALLLWLCFTGNDHFALAAEQLSLENSQPFNALPGLQQPPLPVRRDTLDPSNALGFAASEPQSLRIASALSKPTNQRPKAEETLAKGEWAQAVQQILGFKKIYATPYYIYRGRKPGPHVLIQGGIHGNELAGTFAIDQLIKELQVASGTIVMLPRMNALAIRRRVRQINVDLNRAFGENKGRQRSYEYSLANSVIQLVARYRIKYMVTLHEARLRHNSQTKRHYGQTICYGTKPMPEILRDWLPRLNSNLPSIEKFSAFYSPVPKSSTEVIVKKFSLKGGFCGETWKGLPLPRRIALQRKLILTMLDATGVEYRLQNPRR